MAWWSAFSIGHLSTLFRPILRGRTSVAGAFTRPLDASTPSRRKPKFDFFGPTAMAASALRRCIDWREFGDDGRRKTKHGTSFIIYNNSLVLQNPFYFVFILLCRLYVNLSNNLRLRVNSIVRHRGKYHGQLVQHRLYYYYYYYWPAITFIDSNRLTWGFRCTVYFSKHFHYYLPNSTYYNNLTKISSILTRTLYPF